MQHPLPKPNAGGQPRRERLRRQGRKDTPIEPPAEMEQYSNSPSKTGQSSATLTAGKGGRISMRQRSGPVWTSTLLTATHLPRKSSHLGPASPFRCLFDQIGRDAREKVHVFVGMELSHLFPGRRLGALRTDNQVSTRSIVGSWSWRGDAQRSPSSYTGRSSSRASGSCECGAASWDATVHSLCGYGAGSKDRRGRYACGEVDKSGGREQRSICREGAKRSCLVEQVRTVVADICTGAYSPRRNVVSCCPASRRRRRGETNQSRKSSTSGSCSRPRWAS